MIYQRQFLEVMSSMDNSQVKCCIVISRVFPFPPMTGAIQYSAQIIKQLSTVFDRVEVICSSTDKKYRGESFVEFPPNVYFFTYRPSYLSLLGKVFTMQPLAALKLDCADGRGIIKDRLNVNPDSHVAIDHIGSSWSLRLLEAHLSGSNRMIYCTHNEEFSTRISLARSETKNLFKYLAHQLDAFRAYLVDKRIFKSASLVTCISNDDLNKYSSLYKFRELKLLTAIYEGPIKIDRKDVEKFSKKVAIVGSFFWEAKKNNLEKFLSCCESIFFTEDVQLLVIGNMHSDYLAYLKKRWPTVTFTGRVESIEKHLETVKIGIVAEEFGGGFKLKLLQYVFQRVPIFGLHHAVQGLGLKVGESIMTYANMTELCEGISREIVNEEFLNKLSSTAFADCQKFLDASIGVDVIRTSIFND